MWKNFVNHRGDVTEVRDKTERVDRAGRSATDAIVVNARPHLSWTASSPPLPALSPTLTFFGFLPVSTPTSTDSRYDRLGLKLAASGS